MAELLLLLVSQIVLNSFAFYGGVTFGRNVARWWLDRHAPRPPAVIKQATIHDVQFVSKGQVR